MTAAEQRRHIDGILDRFWEDDAFMDGFCAGCPELRGAYFGDDCPACLDPHDRDCERAGLASAIDAELEAVAAFILGQMRAWGCVR